MNQWVWIAIAAVALLAALALLLVALRSWRRQGARKGRRLGVLERMPIARDAELVLLRRDNVEHLVCLTGGGGFLVEGGIRRQMARREPVAQTPTPPAEPKVTPATPAPAAHAEPKMTPPAAPAGAASRKEAGPPPPPPPGAAAPAPRPARREPAAPEKADSAEAGPGGERE